MHRGLRLLVALALGAGPLGVMAAPAQADPDVAACTVNATWAYAPGLTVVPAAQVVTGTMLMQCAGLDDGGPWTLNFAGGSLEACEAGEGTVFWGPGSASPEGAVVGGGFTYARVGFHTMVLEGTIPVPGVAETHTFVAYMGWVPNLVGACVAPPTVAANSIGVAAVSDL